MASAVRLYDDALREDGHGAAALRARLRDGTEMPLALERWLGRADDVDLLLLRRARAPVLDVGCGPGRHLRALAARGVLALGVDLSPVAVALAVAGGGHAVVGDVFAEVPGAGGWRTALLLDGNIGIGGSPVRLLSRIAQVLARGGETLIELEAPGAPTRCTHARLERGDTTSSWFPWARVAVSEIGIFAALSGFEVVEVGALRGRWFAQLRLP